MNVLNKQDKKPLFNRFMFMSTKQRYCQLQFDTEEVHAFELAKSASSVPNSYKVELCPTPPTLTGLPETFSLDFRHVLYWMIS